MGEEGLNAVFCVVECGRGGSVGSEGSPGDRAALLLPPDPHSCVRSLRAWRQRRQVGTLYAHGCLCTCSFWVVGGPCATQFPLPAKRSSGFVSGERCGASGAKN